jgi:hypothetical protein
MGELLSRAPASVLVAAFCVKPIDCRLTSTIVVSYIGFMQPNTPTKREALKALGLAPVKLTAYESVKFARVEAANDNDNGRTQQKAARHG